MTTTLLQRIHALADKPPAADACKALASIARKLATEDDPADKAHAITGVLREFDPHSQAAIVRALESLDEPVTAAAPPAAR